MLNSWDDDRIGGWVRMYQVLDSGEWLLTDNCLELLRTIPNLDGDQLRVEDVEKMDGDDRTDASNAPRRCHPLPVSRQRRKLTPSSTTETW